MLIELFLHQSEKKPVYFTCDPLMWKYLPTLLGDDLESLKLRSSWLNRDTIYTANSLHGSSMVTIMQKIYGEKIPIHFK